MKNIHGIDGLSVDLVDIRRVVYYKGQECPLIKKSEKLYSRYIDESKILKGKE